MRTDYIYFKVLNANIKNSARQVNFVTDEVIDGEVYNLLPSGVSPVNELIKSADRSLDGTMNVDITGVKTSLEITFGFLSDSDFGLICEIFDLAEQAEKYPDGLIAEYFDIRDSGAKKSVTCFIDNMTYTPFIINDAIGWRDVKINLVEI